MKLYGSKTSPFVRRLRLLMENLDYEFIEVDIFDAEDKKKVLKLSPLGRIPVIENYDEVVLDSRKIFEYLCDSSVHPRPTLEQDNNLTIIDGICDAFINFFQLKKSEIDLPNGSLYKTINVERIDRSFTYLNERVTAGDFAYWDYPSMCLLSLLEWINFRNLYDLSPYTNFPPFLEKFQDFDIVQTTKPST